jgi:UDP-N-acetylglucosamine 2-epimerase
MPKPVVDIVVGTRPEAVKVAPVVHALRKYSDQVECRLISTGQHREILHGTLATFGLVADRDLAIMTPGQTLAQVTTRALEGLDAVLAEEQPAMVLAQGDTTTTFVAGLASFYRQIPFGHIEAGLRTDHIDNPFPEEFNRRAVGLFSALDFAPTSLSRDNLLREGKDPKRVFVTGNTGIDAVLFAAKSGAHPWFPDRSGRLVLLTTHRRENWGEPQRAIARAVRRLADAFPDITVVAALHPNPTVREAIEPILGDHPQVRLIEPPDYAPFVKLMESADLILTDSGGVQEEAPAFGVPVLVLRETTERPEGVTAGTARLVGTDENHVFESAEELLRNEAAYEKMAQAVSPYGDGAAAERIRYLVLRELGQSSSEVSMWT